jgi:predicted transcriptional regulator
VSQKIRETVDAVRDLSDENGITSSAIAVVLNLDTSAAYRQLAEAASKGYVLNEEDRPRRPGRYVVGGPMPEERELLPRNTWSQDVARLQSEPRV